MHKRIILVFDLDELEDEGVDFDAIAEEISTEVALYYGGYEGYRIEDGS